VSHRCARAGPRAFQPVDTRQADVEHDQVETLVAQHARRASAVALPVERVSIAAQAADDHAGQIGLVLDQKNAH
jgi:hypothetical protein